MRSDYIQSVWVRLVKPGHHLECACIRSRVIYTLMAPFSLWWHRWISHIHHFAGGIWNIYTTWRNDRFFPSFLSETPPDPPGLWSILWEVPKGVSLSKLRHCREEQWVSSSSYLYVQETPCFSSLFPVSSLCQHRLAYILYESWLLGVFRILLTTRQ